MNFNCAGTLQNELLNRVEKDDRKVEKDDPNRPGGFEKVNAYEQLI